MMTNEQKNKDLQATLKSGDTEEWIDLLFYRPIGYKWALLFQRMGISPNAVTIASIFLGIGAGCLFYFNDLLLNMAGMCLLIWANMYDSADGQLARMTGQKSELGRILDGLCGDIWFFTIYAAICLRLQSEWGFSIWILAAVTGFFHSKQAAMADYYRNIHLFFLKGKNGSELDNSAQQEALFHSLSWSKDGLFKLFIWFYARYTRSQESLSPAFQRFSKLLKVKYGDSVPQNIRDLFRKDSLPLMKYTNILSFNTRVIVLFLSLLFNLPWLYFVFELTILNGLLIYMIFKHESLCKQLSRYIENK